MVAIIYIILLLMVPIGFFQVLSGISIAITAKNQHARDHAIYYLIGVVGYFGLMYPMGSTVDLIGPGYFVAYFFAGAFGLMVFHLSIFLRRNNEPETPDHAKPFSN